MGAAQHSGLRIMDGAVSRIIRSPARAFVLIFLLSFVVRAALLVSWTDSRKHFYRLGSGIEDRVALSLLRTREFADPYMIPTGPTAHPPPLWPVILALIYYAFGMTATAGVCARACGDKQLLDALRPPPVVRAQARAGYGGRCPRRHCWCAHPAARHG